MKSQRGLSNNFKAYFLSWTIIVLMLIAAVNFSDNNIRLSPGTDEQKAKIYEIWQGYIEGESNLPALWFDYPYDDPSDGPMVEKIIAHSPDFEEEYNIGTNEDASYGSYKEESQTIICIDPETGDPFENRRLYAHADGNYYEENVPVKVLKEIKFNARSNALDEFTLLPIINDNIGFSKISRTVEFHEPNSEWCLEGVKKITASNYVYTPNEAGSSGSGIETKINTIFSPIDPDLRGSVVNRKTGAYETSEFNPETGNSAILILKFDYNYLESGEFENGVEEAYYDGIKVFSRSLGYNYELTQPEFYADPVGLGHLGGIDFFGKYRSRSYYYPSSDNFYILGNSDRGAESNPNPDDSNTNPSADSTDTTNTPSNDNTNNPSPETNDNSPPSQDNNINLNTPEETNIDNTNRPTNEYTSQQNNQNTPPVNEKYNDNPSSNNNKAITKPITNGDSNSDNSQSTASQDNSNTQDTISDRDNNINSENDITANNNSENEEVLPVFNTINDLLNDLTKYLTNLVDKLFS